MSCQGKDKLSSAFTLGLLKSVHGTSLSKHTASGLVMSTGALAVYVHDKHTASGLVMSTGALVVIRVRQAHRERACDVYGRSGCDTCTTSSPRAGLRAL